MIILGIDPGKTTGWCAVMTIAATENPIPVSWGQFGITEDIEKLLSTIITKHKVEVAVVECVVKAGRMTRGKIDQLEAYNRIVTVLNGNTRTKLSVAGKSVLTIVQIPPQTRKIVRSVPREIRGIHARDAYRQAVAYWLVEEGLPNETYLDPRVPKRE